MFHVEHIHKHMEDINMKVNTTIIIDQDVKKIVQAHLKATGMSLSGFINTILCEFAKEIQGQPVMLNKPVKDLTLEEFGNLASYWINKASDLE
jgi:antitoxin component of RelBE/YafQ-DinJ toxin-antitoxin module